VPDHAPAVLVTRKLPERAMGVLRERCDVEVWSERRAIPRGELLARVAGKAGLLALLTERVDAEVLDAAGPQLSVVANLAVGYDNVDVAACTSRAVLVTNTPDVLTETTADLAWALLLACARRVAEGDRLLRARTPWTWGPEFMLGHDLRGKLLGIVGFGRIGQAVAGRAAGFGMTVAYSSPRPAPPELELALRATRRPFDDLLAEADVISIHAPLSERTRHLFGAEQFRRMKPTAILVNTARGPLVDEVALAEALSRGELFAAGLDVFEREPDVEAALLAADNVTLLPHLGSATVETRTAMALLAVENLAAALQGRRPPSLVNPAAWDARR
jgi:glyoxylate reductase